ncbi:MAG: hypothetical protein R3E66_17340 [bacterium]
MKKIVIFALLSAVACESSSDDVRQVEDFSVLSTSDSYGGPPATSCSLADPYETVALVRIVASKHVAPDPSCDVKEPYYWQSYEVNTATVLGSTNPSFEVGSTIEFIEYNTVSFSVPSGGNHDAIFTLRELNGVWVQARKSAYAVDINSASKNSSIDFPTNWSTLKNEVLANQSDYDAKCPEATVVTPEEFEKWALGPTSEIKPGCGRPQEPDCPSTGCGPDDGDDSNGVVITSP